jgi:hypothetical protein
MNMPIYNGAGRKLAAPMLNKLSAIRAELNELFSPWRTATAYWPVKIAERDQEKNDARLDLLGRRCAQTS